MEILFFIILLAAVLLIVSNAPKPGAPSGTECKLHEWKFMDIVDVKGEKQGERMRCVKCGKVPGSL